jgi:hypothetical protein
VLLFGPVPIVSEITAPFASVPVTVKEIAALLLAEVSVTVVDMFEPSLTADPVKVIFPAPDGDCKAAIAVVFAETALNIFACILVLDIFSPNTWSRWVSRSYKCPEVSHQDN